MIISVTVTVNLNHTDQERWEILSLYCDVTAAAISMAANY